MRRAHFLQSNKARTFPTRILLFDTETTATPISKSAEKHTLRLGVACYWQRRGGDEADTFEWVTFRDRATFWDFLVSRAYSRTRLACCSHNLSFDLAILQAFTELPQRSFELTSYYCKGITTLVRFKRKGKRLDFVDSTNFFPGTLESLAPLVGLEKLEIDFATVSDEELEVYCRRDVEILLGLWRKWLDFLQIHDLGKWCRTLPSQALGAYRHRFMRHKVLIHDHEAACKLERRAYHGGRVEVLRTGHFEGGPFYKLDVNSMYPYVMRRYPYPAALYRYVEKPTPVYVVQKLKRYRVIADCLVETSNPAFPQSIHGHTCYPVGQFRAVLCTEELRYLLQVGQIHQVYACSYYRGAPLFNEYVDLFYSLKARYDGEDNVAFRVITKGFLNFLYGKFGQRGLKDTIIGECPLDVVRVVECYDLKSGKPFDLIQIAGKVIRRDREDESYNSFPAIAAEVSANARMVLFSLLTLAGRDNVFYLDTDSFIVNERGYRGLAEYCHPSRLGALKVEGITSEIEIRAPKDYTFGGEDRIKGIRENATQIAPGVYRQDRFPSIQGLLRRENLEEYVVTKETKRLSRTITGGTLTEEGFVLPFRLPLAVPFPLETPPPPSSPPP